MSIRTPLRELAKGALPAGQTVRRLPFGIGRGVRLRIDFHGGQVGMYLGLYEIELNKYIRQLCPKGTSCFDIGGQMGYDALVMAKLAGSPVVTVECDPGWCRVIQENARANPDLEPLLLVHQGFVGKIDDPTAGLLTLDTLVDLTFLPRFVKIDIEGTETAALEGAERLLSTKPGFLIEVHSAALERECDTLLRRSGYSPFVVNQRSWIRDHRPSDHNRWLIAPSPLAY